VLIEGLPKPWTLRNGKAGWSADDISIFVIQHHLFFILFPALAEGVPVCHDVFPFMAIDVHPFFLLPISPIQLLQPTLCRPDPNRGFFAAVACFPLKMLLYFLRLDKINNMLRRNIAIRCNLQQVVCKSDAKSSSSSSDAWNSL
jgi:hypothetical protein